MSDRYRELIDIGESRTLDDCNELPLKGEYLCAGHLLVWRANGGKDKGD